MKKLFFISLAALFGACIAIATDIKANAKAQAADITSQTLSGKSAKEIAADKKAEVEKAVSDSKAKATNKKAEAKTNAANKKAEAKAAVKEETDKQINDLLNKF